MLFTSSSSYETSLGGSYSRVYELPERPHTSPPSLSSYPPFSASLDRPRKIYRRQNDIFRRESDSLNEGDDDVFTIKTFCTPKLLRSNTLSDLRALASVQGKIGSKEVGKIGKQMLRRHQEKSSRGLLTFS